VQQFVATLCNFDASPGCIPEFVWSHHCLARVERWASFPAPTLMQLISVNCRAPTTVARRLGTAIEGAVDQSAHGVSPRPIRSAISA
jgi:hypothetical protein